MVIDRNNFKVSLVKVLFLGLAISSGFRTGGADYDNYLLMINRITLQDTFFLKVLVAKDPMFGVITAISNFFWGSEAVYVFVSFSLLSFLALNFFISKLYKYTFIFFFSYLVLFAPALDFAAIRAFLAIMFFCAYLATKSDGKVVYSTIFAFLSIFTHISMLLPVLISSKWFFKMYSRSEFMSLSVLFLGSFSSGFIFSRFSNTLGYQEISASPFAYIYILFFISGILVYRFFLLDPIASCDFNKNCFRISLIISVASIGFTSVMLVAGMRFLQISQILFLMALCSSSYHLLDGKRQALWFYCWFTLSIPLLITNYSFDLWNLMFEHIKW